MAARTAFLTAFVGRRQEIEDVARAVQDHHLVTLIGVGGLGKTRLANEALDRLADRFGERVWVAELADLQDPALVGHLVSAAMDAPSPGEVFDPAALVAFVGDGPGLLLLDNCEHLLEASAALATALLRGCPGLHVLTTSRQRLGVTGEHLYPVPSLDAEDAAALFGARALAAAPGWVADP
ncbi:MAG: AfsR/SARP family transcriptional regulator, partial [Marmoricola sp.]